MNMHTSGSEPAGPEDFERELRRSLFRFDCPDAQTLGEYQLGMVDEGDRVRIASHAADCDECLAELQTLRGYLAASTDVPEPTLSRVRRIVATLFAPRPGLAYGGLRGGADTLTRVYEADDVTITLGPGQSRDSLLGLVVLAANQSPEALDGQAVRLLPRDGAPIRTQIDDLGNFEFTALAPGLYALEIDLPDGVVVIEELRLD
jgi:hypothetical protein